MNTRICQNCGSPLSEVAKFCNRCGAPVGAEIESPAPVQPDDQVRAAINTHSSVQHINQVAPTQEAPGLQPDYRQGAPPSVVGEEERKHGGCLGTFLVLAMVANLAFGVITLIGADDLDGIYLISALLNFAGVVFAYAIWKWKKWGVYGYIGVIGVTSLINLASENFAAAAQGIVPILVLAGLVRSVWKHME